VNRPIPKGYPGHAGDPVPVHPGMRSLTTQERALIQTFPPDFLLPGCKSDVEQVIGNAVPVKLAEYVASRLLDFMRALEGQGECPMPCQLFAPRQRVVPKRTASVL